MNRKMLIAGCFVIASAICACKNNDSNTGTKSIDSSASARDTSQTTVYSCPMDTEITSDQPGQCPKCGMDLEIRNR